MNGEGVIYPYPHGFRAYVWVTTPTGRRQRKYVSGRTCEIVREKYLKLHEASRRGPVAARIPTVTQFVGAWIEEVIAPTLAPGTVSSYRMCARLYIEPELGSAKRLDKLTVRDVQGWLNRLRKQCQCCAQGKDGRAGGPGVLLGRQMLPPGAGRLDGASGVCRTEGRSLAGGPQ